MTVYVLILVPLDTFCHCLWVRSDEVRLPEIQLAIPKYQLIFSVTTDDQVIVHYDHFYGIPEEDFEEICRLSCLDFCDFTQDILQCHLFVLKLQNLWIQFKPIRDYDFIT
jgi:hypothetical protein